LKRDDAIYLAGLFDGEGCVTYKKYWDRKRKDRPRKYLCWRIALEIVMTDKPTIQWCADKFGGKVYKKPIEEKKEDLHEIDRPRYEEQSEEEYLRHCERFFKGEGNDKLE